jgi:tetratricopeptide (TPR) repeat protein
VAVARTIRTCKETQESRPRLRVRNARIGLALILAGTSVLFAWESVQGRAAVEQSRNDQSSNIVGSYLAARHARAEREEGAAASFYAAALKASPHEAMLYRRAITATILSGRVAEGIRLSEELLKLEPDNPLAVFAVGVGHLHDGRPSQAESVLKRLPGDSLVGVAGVLMRAWILHGRKDAPGASEALNQLQALPAVAYLSYLHAAWMLDAAGSPGQAADTLRVVLANQPEPWFRLAELAGAVYLRAGKPEEAAEVSQRYVATHGMEAPMLTPAPLPRGHATAKARLTSARDGAAEALFDVACVASRQNQREQALLLGLLGLYLKPDSPSLQLVVAELMESVDRLADANRIYQAIDRASPLSWVARLAAARNLDSLDRFGESESLLRTMAEERGDAAEPLIQLGDELRRLERFSEAVQVYDQAAARIGSPDRRHWRFLYARGIALERTKAWDRAEADFLKALEFEADQPFILNYLGYSWVEQGKNLARAEGMIERAVELRPNDGYIVDSLGWVLYRRGRYDSAVEKLERAVELKPEDPVINDHLGDAYWAVGRQREARFQWRASLVRDPEPELRASLEKKLSEGLVREASNVQP